MPKKLCNWDRNKIKKKLIKLNEIVKGSKYLCENCGRCAKKNDYLCKPLKMKDN